MLKIVTGPFHPDLEIALLDSLRTFKASDRLAPLAIIVPSGRLRRRLQWRIAVEGGLALLNTHVMTFHQLTIRLSEEAGAYDPTSVLPSLFFRELVHQILRGEQQTSPASYWHGLIEMPGAWAALWATVKDLKDAGVDGERVLDALSTPDAPKDPGLAPLIQLFLRVMVLAEREQVYDHDDLARVATAFVQTSGFLGRLTHVLYYGFYDLTQVQLDLFQAVARACPTTLFFPLIRSHPAFAFAKKFFDNFLHGLLNRESDWIQTSLPRPSVSGGANIRRLFAVAEEDRAEDTGTAGEPNGPVVRIVQTSGHEDEMTFVAKDLLSLVEDQGYAWHEIGIVTRTFAGYEAVLPRVLHAQGIPFTTSLTLPLSTFPLAKTAVHLLDLKLQGYRRDLVIDLLSSPVLRLKLLCPTDVEPRPDLWNVLSRRVGITRGLDEWRRLAAYEQTGLSLRRGWSDEDGPGADGSGISGDQVRALLACVTALEAALNRVPDQGTWGEFMAATRVLWDQLLETDQLDVVAAFASCVDEMNSLCRFAHTVSFADFVTAVHRHVEESTVPIASDAEAGVQVLDAMAARGLCFRVLYVLGLNERVFPRHIREDAFLRDASRRFLETDLGFKIQEKLSAFEEEKLLFYLLANAAGERLTLMTLRSDEAGRALVPSLYLDEVRRLDPGLVHADLVVPRRWTDRWTHARLPQYGKAWLTVSEWAQQQLLLRRMPTSLESRHPCGEFLLRGIAGLQRLESGEATMGERDGVVGVLPAYWRALKTRGLSPTSLERYAKCPFQYFASEVLGLEPLESPEAVGETVPLEIGTLAHALLKEVFHTLVARGYFADSGAVRPDPIALVKEVAPAVFDAYARTHPIGYPLLWELQRETLTQLISQVVTEDLAAMTQGEPGDWQPILFEAPVEGSVKITLAAGAEEFPLQGRVDRVDWSEHARAFRVIDYKYKTGGNPQSTDLNLARAAARGAKLQPPFYLLMAQTTLSRTRPAGIGSGAVSAEGVWFYYLAPNWRKRDSDPILRPTRFPGNAWQSSLRGSLDRALAAMLSGIRAGEFFMYPGAQCDVCDFAALCRKNHQPSWWRARADHGRVEPYRRLRRAEPEPQ